MKIKLLNFGLPENMLPRRIHANDVGADVFATCDYVVEAGNSLPVPLKFGLDLPAGFGAFVFPRTSQSKRGVDCKLAPLDPGYTGEMHALIHNGGHEAYEIHAGDRIGQLVILPVALPDFVASLGEERGAGAFGSTGT